MRLAVVLSAVLALASGCEVDCFDNGPLEQSFHDGQTAAETANTAAFNDGYATGRALTQVDGEREGAEAGYNAGFITGYHSPAGYDSGYAAAYDLGAYDGSRDLTACSIGTGDGYSDGTADGEREGYDSAWSSGWAAGYSDGQSEGQAWCDSQGVAAAAPHEDETVTPSSDADRKDLRVCYARGYSDIEDWSSYARGLSDGKRDNPEYQDGYRAAYPGVHAGASALNAILLCSKAQ